MHAAASVKLGSKPPFAAPAARKRCAIANPIPPAAPVITAVFFYLVKTFLSLTLYNHKFCTLRDQSKQYAKCRV
jgi:hypothetical protein